MNRIIPTQSSKTYPAEPERCRFERWGRVYTCSLPHCQGCGSHFNPGKHTEAVLCGACREWATLERNVPQAVLEEARSLAQRLIARTDEAI
jgi:hypothetical protein